MGLLFRFVRNLVPFSQLRLLADITLFAEVVAAGECHFLNLLIRFMDSRCEKRNSGSTSQHHNYHWRNDGPLKFAHSLSFGLVNVM